MRSNLFPVKGSHARSYIRAWDLLSLRSRGPVTAAAGERANLKTLSGEFSAGRSVSAGRSFFWREKYFWREDYFWREKYFQLFKEAKPV